MDATGTAVRETQFRGCSLASLYNSRRPHSSLDGMTPDQAYFHPAATPLGSLTLADAPLIEAENLFKQPGPPLCSGAAGQLPALEQTRERDA